MTRYGLNLKLDCDNAAFDDGARADEIARVLRRLADQFESGHGGARYALIHGLMSEGALFDTNGNRCGAWDAKRRRIRND